MPDQITHTKSQSGFGNERQGIRASQMEIEKKYHALVTNIDEGFCVVEMINDARGNPIDYRFVEINSAFERNTGLKNVVGKTIREVVPTNEAHWFEIYGKVARTGESIRFKNKTMGLGRHFDVFAYRIGGKGSRFVGILFKDITERKKAEDERKEKGKKYPLLFENTTGEKLSTPVANKFKKLSLLLSILVVFIGVVVLIGWAADISFLKNLSSKWISMKVNTALCFLFAGFTLILLNGNKIEGRRKIWPLAFSAIIFCIATVTLLEYIFHFNAGIDELFFKDPLTVTGTASPGRPAIPTALCFFLIGTALFLMTIKKIGILLFQGLNLAVGLAALFSLLGYLFRIKQVTDGSLYTAIALPSSINFLMLVLASLFLLPEEGIMKLVSSDTSGGRFIRRLLPLIILTIIISAWLSMEEKWAGFYDVYIGMTVYVTIIIIVFTIIIFGNANSLTKSEKKLKRETEFSNYLLDSVPGLFYLIDETGRLLKWNKTFEKETSCTPGEIAEMKALDFFTSEDQNLISGKLQESFDKGESSVEANLKSKTGQLTPYYFNANRIVLEGKTLLLGTALNITARKIAEQERELFYKFFTTARDIMVVADPLGCFKKVNPACLQLLGYSEEELISKPFVDFIYKEDKQKTVDEMTQQMQLGYSLNFENRYACKNGTLLWLSWRAQYSAEEGITYATARDVTESKQMEQKLTASETRLKEAQRLAKIGNWELDLLTNELKWSDEIYRIFELDPKVFSATYDAFLNAIHPDDRAYVSHAYETSVANHTTYRIDHRLLMKDGNIKHVHEQCVTFYDVSGKPIRSIGTVQDISERKMMEELLRSANIYTRSLIEASLDPLVTISPEGKITDVNNATIKVTGVERTKLVGTDFSNYFTEPGKAKKGYQQVLKEGFVTDYPLIIRSSNGKLTEVLYNASVYKDVSGKIIGVFAAARDVTAQKKAEVELHKLNTTLEEKVKERTGQYETVNKDLESFTYSVSHDLRAPLRAIHSYSQILNEDYGESIDAEGKQLLENIKYNTAKMGKLIDELLAFSRLGRKQLERTEVDMNILVKEVIDDLNNAVTHHAQITVSELPVVKGDNTLLSQVMHNLISNAIKYSSKKEEPFVEIFTIPKKNKDEKTVFVVKDNGVGFDMRYADKLFGVFQRLHSEKEFEGIGVGLAIVKRIVNKHGGEVWGHGEENKGASFYFTLN